MPRPSDAVLTALALGLFVIAGVRSFSGSEVRPFDGAEHVPEWRSQFAGDAGRADDGRPRMLIYSDFACGACRLLDSMVRVDTQLTSRFEVHYRHISLIGGEPSKRAALFMHCSIGTDLGFSPQATLFQRNGSLDDAVDDLEARLATNGDAGERIARCLKSDSASASIRADEKWAARLALNSTPGILVDSMLFRGLPPDLLERLRRVRDR